MSWLRALERAAEEVVEGSARRLFRPTLQPIQVAKAAARALDDSRMVGPLGQQVANTYRIALNPADFVRFGHYRQTLAQQVIAYLDRYAGDRGLVATAPWRVELASDPRVRSGGVVVEQRHDEPPPPNPTIVADPADLAGTRRMPIVPPAPAGPAAIGAWLEVETGARVVLSGDHATIGRALDNTLPIEDERVSRQHATIERAGRDYLLRDLQSTNGTFVNGQPVGERPLHDGDVVSFGGVAARFRLAGPR